MTTLLERVEALRNLGYGRREAEFLCLAALHSGYFLRRQYRAYLGTKPGWADDLLIAKITNLGHGRILTLGFKTQVCHLSARPFYRAIGEEHNRHRRMRSDLSIRTKLMALDYVLAGADPVYLATEREKVEFFTGRLGIDVDCLPTKTYRSHTSAETTDRYFVDKFPIGIPQQSTSPVVVSFTYIDEGSVATPGFETWLEQYSTLMGTLERFRVVFVATTDMNFRWAEFLFQRWLPSLPRERKSLGVASTDRLIEYLQLERDWRSGNRGRLDSHKIDRLKHLRQEFGDARSQRLLEIWQQAGDQAVVRYLDETEHVEAPGNATFSTYRLPWKYDIFRPLRAGKR